MFARMDVRVTYVFETRGACVLRAYRPGYCIRISALRRFVANMGRWLACALRVYGREFCRVRDVLT